MASLTSRYFLLFLLLPFAINGNATVIQDEESEDIRQPRVSGRIVKLYSGNRPEPILCSSEGFKEDPHDCTVFYRCIRSSNGKYTAFRFQCGPGTVYDPETEVCNHPRNTKRSECRDFKESSIEQNSNEVEEFEREVPKPISTKIPVYSGSSTIKTSTVTSSTVTSTSKQQTTLGNVKDTTRYPHNFIGTASTTTKHPEYRKNVTFEFPTSTISQQRERTTTHGSSMQENICTSEGFMGDIENCHKFYRCVGNQRGSFMKFEFSCSELTIWDDEIKACNHPWAVKRSRCGRSNVELNDIKKLNTTKDSYLENIQTTIFPFSTEKQISDTSSQKSHSIPEQVKENKGEETDKFQTSYELPSYHSNNDKLNQLSQKQEESKKTTTTRVPTDITQTSPVSNTGDKDNVCTRTGFFGDSHDCKKFYRCVDTGKGNYIKHEFSCGEGTVWDQNLEGCNHAWAVPNCGGNFVSADSNTESVFQTSPVSSTNGFTPTTTEAQVISEIDSEEDVGYGNINSPVATSTSRSTTIANANPETPKVNDCKSPGLHGDSKDCSVFYRCVEDGTGAYIKYEFRCSTGTLWDSALEACNHAWAVKDCNGTSTEDIPTTTSTGIIVTSTQITMSSQNPSTSIALTSTTGLDQSGEEEDPGYNGQINEVTSSTTTLQNTLPNEVDQCKTDGFFGNKYDCTKFYRCVNNGDGTFNKFDFTCGEGTVWDNKIEACNHAWAVENCNGSNVPMTSENVIQITTSSPQFTSTSKVETTTVGAVGETTSHTVSSSTTSTTTINESIESNCQSTGFIGDATNCKKFYRCVDNGDGTFTKFEFSCGEGTVWDQKIGSCNHAWAVENCGKLGEDQNVSTGKPSIENKPTSADEYENGHTSSNVTTTPVNQIQTTPSTQVFTNICHESGFVVDKHDCQKFYRCVEDGKGGFIQYEYRCVDGTVWDSSIESCNHVWAAQNCQFGGTTNQTIETSTYKTSTASADQILQSTVSPVIVTSEASTENDVDDICKSEGFIDDKKDCRKFYRCIQHSQGFIKYEFQCGEGTYWNQEIQACDHASSNQNCLNKEHENTHNQPQIENDDIYTETTTVNNTVPHIPANPQESEGSESLCEKEGFFGDHNDCKKFYRCVSDSKDGYTKYDFTCGDGTIWNQAIMGCDHPTAENKCLVEPSINQTQESNVGQDSSITSTQNPHSTQETGTPPVTESTECISEGFYANSYDCKKFFRCVKDDKGGYVKYDFVCGSGTIWVQEIQACDHDNGIESCSSMNTTETSNTHVSTQTTTIAYTSTTNQISSSAPTLTLTTQKNDVNYTSTKKPNEACSAEGFYENENDCKIFYRCVDNGQGGYTKYEFTCGEGTAWDATIEGCNHIENVKSCNSSRDEENQTQPTLHDEMPDTEEDKKSTTIAPSSSQSTESTNSEEDDDCESEGYFGDSNDCKKFYRCVDNGKGDFTKYDFTCGEGTIWDQDLTTCNHPQDVSNPSCIDDGDNDMISSTETYSSSTTPSTSNTSPQSTSTTENNSSSNSSNSSEDSSSSKPSQNITCTKAGFYPNPNDCKKFYRCVDWDNNGENFSVFHFECGEGTIWDPALDTCNYEESVYPPRDCSGTQSQNQNTGQETTTTEQNSSTQTTSITTVVSVEDKTTQETSPSETTTTGQTTQTSTTEAITSQQSTTTEATTQQTTSTSVQTSTQKTTTATGTTQQQTSTQTSTQQTTTEPSTTQQQTSAQTTIEPSTTQQETSSETTTQKATTMDSVTTQEQTTDNSVTDETTTTTKITTTQSTTTEVSSTTIDESPNTTASEASTTVAVSTTEQTTTQESNYTQSTTNLTDESTTEAMSATEESSESSSPANEGSTAVTTEPTTNSETSETPSEENGKCPETEDDQNVFVCPTSFRTHPKYCNIFYQCTEDEESHEIKIATFKCPNNTIYDETQTKCVEQEKANTKCEGEISSRRRLKHLAMNYKEPITVTKDSHSCSSEGDMPFEKNSECSPAFLKCEKSKQGKLRGIVHQCPQNYVYWSISRRCERIDKVRDCKRTTNNWNGRWEIPIDRHNVAW